MRGLGLLLAGGVLAGIALAPGVAQAEPPCGYGWRRHEWCGPYHRDRYYRGPAYRERVYVQPPRVFLAPPPVYYAPPAPPPIVYAPPPSGLNTPLR
jgi:hypothetical protein